MKTITFSNFVKNWTPKFAPRIQLYLLYFRSSCFFTKVTLACQWERKHRKISNFSLNIIKYNRLCGLSFIGYRVFDQIQTLKSGSMLAWQHWNKITKIDRIAEMPSYPHSSYVKNITFFNFVKTWTPKFSPRKGLFLVYFRCSAFLW